MNRRNVPTLAEILFGAAAAFFVAWTIVYTAVRFVEFFQALSR